VERRFITVGCQQNLRAEGRGEEEEEEEAAVQAN